MADKKIEEATLAESITGTDVVPAAVGTTPAPRKVKFDTIKAFVIAALEALGAATEVGVAADKVMYYSDTDGGLRYCEIGRLSTTLIGLLFNGTVVTEDFDGTEKFIINDGDSTKNATLSQLLAYVKANIGDVMDIAGLTAASSLSITDEIPIHVDGETGNKKTTFDEVEDMVIDSIPGRSPSITGEIGLTDEIMFSRNGCLKKVSLQNSGLTKGGAIAPATTTTGKIPQWANNNKELTNGKTVVTSVGASGAASNDNIPTEAAVRGAVDACAKKPGSTTANKIPQWSDANGTMKDGLSVRDSASELGSSDSSVPTSLAVRDFVNGRSTVDSTVYEDIEDLPTVSAQNGDHIVCNFLVSGVARKTAFVYCYGWKFLGWVVDSIPTASQELSTLFKGIGSTLPTSANKSQLFMLSGNTTAANDGLYVATVTSASDPQWKKLTYSA